MKLESNSQDKLHHDKFPLFFDIFNEQTQVVHATLVHYYYIQNFAKETFIKL